jgi:hypothetical protein
MKIRSILAIGAFMSMVSVAFAGESVMSKMQQAQSNAQQSNKQGVVFVVLDQTQPSEVESAVMLHNPSVLWSFRKNDMVVFQQETDGSYRQVYMSNLCDGMSPCAQDAFLNTSFSQAEMNQMLQQKVKAPMVVAYKAEGTKPVGVAYGQFDSTGQAIRFGLELQKATEQSPAQYFSDSVLDD